MAIAITDGTEAIGTTEWSLPRDLAFDAAQPQTTTGHYEVMLDLSALASGDVFRLALYEKATSAGTQRKVGEWDFSGAQASPGHKQPLGILGRGWDVTLKRIAGTDRTIPWSIRSVT